MSTQNFTATRRKFLKRSALGAGGAIFLPYILESCVTDHNIPDPENPDQHPLYDSSIDWNDDAKIMVTSIIEMIPEAGDILGGLLDIFWPSSGENVWDQIRANVEALVDQKIAENVYQNVSDDLGSLGDVPPSGLIGALTLYLNEVKEGTPSSILTQWMITRSLFINAIKHFQSSGYEVPLLPLFAQFANLYLGLLRDGVAFGESWGRDAAEHQQDIADLQNSISSFFNYALTYRNAGGLAVVQKTKRDDHACEPFRTVNTYDRQMNLIVMDYAYTWAYFDVTLYPQGTQVNLTREIYSDPLGTCDDSGLINIVTPHPSQRPTNVTVWGGSLVNAAQVTYPSGGGPGGATQTKRMGTGGGGTPTSFNLTPDNPIIAARVGSGDIINSLQFGLADGTQPNKIGNGGGDSGWLGYPYEFLSSIHINGVSDFYDCADSVVFGFQFWTPPTSALNAVKVMYVKSPKERSAADFAKEFPKLAISDDLITGELKAARKLYWENIAARAKAIKG